MVGRNTHWPTAGPDCPDCKGYGYALFTTDSTEHSPQEVQRVDGCDCLTRRARLVNPDETGEAGDDLAALVFVRDLEHGFAYAVAIARELLPPDACEHDWREGSYNDGQDFVECNICGEVDDRS